MTSQPEDVQGGQRALMDELANPTRRQFGQQLATLAGAPLVGVAHAAEVQAQASPANQVVEALFEIVRGRYGRFLTPAQLDRVKASIARNQAISELLKKEKLTNDDEPAFAFRADWP